MSRLRAGYAAQGATRVAALDPKLWCELFWANKETLANLTDELTERLAEYSALLHGDDRAALLSTINASIGLACAAFELLPGTQDRDILDHILYSGLPAAALSVAEGTFHPEKKHRRTT